jgi:hypothetical protein
MRGAFVPAVAWLFTTGCGSMERESSTERSGVYGTGPQGHATRLRTKGPVR